jgi:hypothetical protein
MALFDRTGSARAVFLHARVMTEMLAQPESISCHIHDNA